MCVCKRQRSKRRWRWRWQRLQWGMQPHSLAALSVCCCNYSYCRCCLFSPQISACFPLCKRKNLSFLLVLKEGEGWAEQQQKFTQSTYKANDLLYECSCTVSAQCTTVILLLVFRLLRVKQTSQILYLFLDKKSSKCLSASASQTSSQPISQWVCEEKNNDVSSWNGRQTHTLTKLTITFEN